MIMKRMNNMIITQKITMMKRSPSKKNLSSSLRLNPLIRIHLSKIILMAKIKNPKANSSKCLE